MAQGKLYWTDDGQVEKIVCRCGFAIEFIPSIAADDAVDRMADRHKVCPVSTSVIVSPDDEGYCDVCKGSCQGH